MQGWPAVAWEGQMEPGDKIIDDLNIVLNMPTEGRCPHFFHSPGVTALQVTFQPGSEL